jgi:hypothetical protein
VVSRRARGPQFREARHLEVSANGFHARLRLL